jgi:hypothetical protein
VFFNVGSNSNNKKQLSLDHAQTRYGPVVSSHILSVATFVTIVATRVLLLPLMTEFRMSEFTIRNRSISEQLYVATFVSTWGEWRQGWTTLV